MLFKNEAKETDTLFKGQTGKKWHPIKGETKTMNGTIGPIVFPFCDTWSLKPSNVELFFSLARDLCTAMLDNTI